MKHLVLDTYEDLSNRTAELIIDQLKTNNSLLLGAATGNTPSGLYARLAELSRKSPAAFSAMRVFKLDEWAGLAMEDPGSCESYIRARLLQPLKIGDDRYFTFNSNPADPEAECINIQKTLDRQGPIDICILGIGTNGHICFNEPAPFLTPHAHLATLAPSSQIHSMVSGTPVQVRHGLTIGIADIMQSRMILLLISGATKRDIVSQLMTRRITTALPASLLWLHPNAICLMDRDAAQ